MNVARAELNRSIIDRFEKTTSLRQEAEYGPKFSERKAIETIKGQINHSIKPKKSLVFNSSLVYLNLGDNYSLYLHDNSLN